MGIAEYISDLSGLPDLSARYFISLSSGYLLAFVFHQVAILTESRLLQNIVSSFGGFFMLYYVFGTDAWHSLVDIIVVYGILYLFGGTKLSVLLTWIVTMGHIIVGYIEIFLANDIHPISWTIPHSMLVLRLIGFAHEYYDSTKEEKLLSEEEKKYRIKELPLLIEFLGYCYFFGAVMVGPAFPFIRYQKFVSGTLYDRNVTPSSIPAGLLRFVQGFLVGCTYAILDHYFPLNYILTEEYDMSSFTYKIAMMVLVAKVGLYKYMSVWMIAEGSSIITGISYDGVDSNGSVDWGGVCNAKIWKHNFGITISSVIESTNLKTAEWVARHLYKRLKWMGSKHLSLMVTVVFLALWHGIWTGYFLFFFFEFIGVTFERQFLNYTKPLHIRQLSWPVFIPVWLTFFIIKNVVMGQTMVMMLLLSFEACWKLQKSIKFLVFIMAALWLIIYQLLPKKKGNKVE